MYLNLYTYVKAEGKGYPLRMDADKFDSSLGECEVEVGIDQSSSNVGFYILDRLDRFHIIGNISKAKYGETSTFLKYVQHVFATLLKNCKVKLFVREKPLPYAGDRTSKVLYGVAKFFDEWVSPTNYDMPMFSGLPPRKIPPNVWRKHIIDKSKGKGRSTQKISVVEDLLDKYPEFYPYLHSLPASTDYDGFEAMGILLGYKKEHGILFSETGNATSTILAGDREFLGNIALYYKFFNSVKETSFRDDLNNLLRYDEELPVLELNPGKSLYDNYRVAASTHAVSLIVIQDQAVIKSLQMLYKHDGEYANVGVLCIRNNELNEGYRIHLSKRYFSELQTWF